jgi:hypothetical protein
MHYKEGDYGDDIIDLRFRRGAPATRKLRESEVPSRSEWPKPVYCAGCDDRYCTCGECHTPGCVNVRVVCERAQRALVVRRNVPVDGPKKRRFWQK